MLFAASGKQGGSVRMYDLRRHLGAEGLDENEVYAAPKIVREFASPSGSYGISSFTAHHEEVLVGYRHGRCVVWSKTDR